MIDGIKIVLAIVSALLLLVLILAGVQTWRLDKAQGSIARTTEKLTEAQEDTARWQATAKARAVSSEAQADLAAACIKREEQAHADAADLAIILGAAKTDTITPDQARKGVDDATRTRIADMLNRPL